MYSIDTMQRVVSNANLRNTFDLDTLELQMTDPHHIQYSTLTTRKSVHATKIVDISVSHTDNDETIGVVQIENVTKQKHAHARIWVALDVFLKGNKERVFAHKNMLFEYTNKHYQYRENQFYPIFVQSDVRLNTTDKKQPTKVFPGVIIGTDSNSALGYFTALYSTRPAVDKKMFATFTTARQQPLCSSRWRIYLPPAIRSMQAIGTIGTVTGRKQLTHMDTTQSATGGAPKHCMFC
jgi:hypothetical protein